MTWASARVRAVVALGLAWLTGCYGEQGTYAIALIESPDAPVLAQVTRLVLTIDQPALQREVRRNEDGEFSISLEVAADDRSGRITLLGYDGGDNVVAVGATPPVPWSARDGELRIFMAAPDAFATVGAALAVPRTRLAVAPALGGAALAGGVDADGMARAEVSLYSAFTHRLVDLAAMPAPRVDAGLAWDALGRLHVFGGLETALGAAPSTSTWWLLGGAGTGYQTLGSSPSWSRAVPLVALGERYLLAPGVSSLLLDAQAGVGSLMTMPPLAGQVVATDGGGVLCVGAGCGEGDAGSGAVAATLQGAQALTLEVAADAPPPAFAALREHRLAHREAATYVVGGARQGEAATGIWALRQASATTLRAEVVASLATPRLAPAVAVVGRWLVIAGGYDPATGAPLASAELIALASPAEARTVPLAAPRGAGALIVLGSGDALLVGGTTTAGAPLAALELFVPAR